MATANSNNPHPRPVKPSRFAALVASLLLLPAFVSICAQDLHVPKVLPRPANTLVMLPDGSTVHVELAKTEAERNFGLMERTSLP
ncbi:MAG TPA: hypothetical protein VK670_13195, partial [Silvibacterium sp.]|nr:hypothetical protein [Silvibacterium sp.]